MTCEEKTTEIEQGRLGLQASGTEGQEGWHEVKVEKKWKLGWEPGNGGGAEADCARNQDSDKTCKERTWSQANELDNTAIE